MTYCEVERTVVGGVMPLGEPLALAASAELATDFFCERRELGVINLGGAGSVRVDGEVFELGRLEALYVGRGAENIVFASASVAAPAALCVKERCLPRDVYESHMPVLQQQLLKDDLTIVHLRNEDPDDLALLATVSASSHASRLDGPENVINGLTRPLDENQEMWIGRVPNNMWISDPTAEMPQWVALDFGRAETVNAVYLTFDTNLKTKRYISWEQTLAERMPP